MRRILFLFFLLVTCYGNTQVDNIATKLIGTWVSRPTDDNILFERSDSLEFDNYGLTFKEDGTLTRRNNASFFSDEMKNYPGKWTLNGDTLTLLYLWTSSKSQEIVIVRQLDENHLRFERLDWIEIWNDKKSEED